MASYRLSDRALADLERLYERGVVNFGLRLADEYYDGLTARMQEISDRPELYPAAARASPRACPHAPIYRNKTCRDITSN